MIAVPKSTRARGENEANAALVLQIEALGEEYVANDQ
jgi:hypothetical protein